MKADAKLSELTVTNRYRMVLNGAGNGIADKLKQLEQVTNVEVLSTGDGKSEVLVEGAADADLGAILFEQAKQNDWPVCELARNTRTLESVYRELSAGREVQL
ncbi:MAG: hypothetical protein D6806_15795 [Deltaproteobacteria bacterium]|nr:MAG: hypothetical protein D6806_15795 [Deltaproteobacteria bacterium]